MPKYYGPDEVKNVIPGENHVIIDLVNGKRVTLSPKMADKVITDEPVDATKLREMRLHPVVEAVLTTMLDWNVKINEIEYIYQLVTTSFNENYKAASDMAWGIADQDRTIQDVDNVLKSKK